MDVKNISINDLLKLLNVKTDQVEYLKVYDKKGKYIGDASRELCHKIGLYHEVVFCFIVNNKNQILLQLRNDKPKTRLDISAGGHVSAGDSSIYESISREIKEEINLDIDVSRLKKITRYRRDSYFNIKKPNVINNEFRYLFYYKLNKDEENNINNNFIYRKEQDRVLSINWFNIEDILNACSENNVADGLSSSMGYYLFWLINNKN